MNCKFAMDIFQNEKHLSIVYWFAHTTIIKKYYFDPYILRLLSIWFLHFGNCKFGLCYFQLVVNFGYIYLVNKSLISYEIINIQL